MTQSEQKVCRLPDRIGEIQEIINRFSCPKDELKVKILETLEHDDPGMSISSEFDEPSFYLDWVYKRLPKDNQRAFQKATVEILNSLAASPETSMSAESADQVMIMLHEVFTTDSPEHPQVIENLKKIIEDESTCLIKTQLTPDITISMHMRAVQMLAGFHIKEPVSFWDHLVKKFGNDYAPLASCGVFNSDFDTGIQWLIDHKDIPETLDSFVRSLPYYYETKFGTERCDNAIETLIPHVSIEYAKMLRFDQQSIKDWLKREN